MGKTYDKAPDEVRDRVIALIKRFHPDLETVRLRVDLLMASTDTEDAHAVTHGGYPALAVVRIVAAKDRAKDCGDAEIVIDRDAYESMESAQRDALLDHELYHLEIVRNKIGQPRYDDHGRPKLKMRKHDFQVGWFHEIARRHGQKSHEVRQATEFINEQGQLYFGFGGDVMKSRIPKPAGSPLDGAVQKFADNIRESGLSVTISSNGLGAVKIDKDGVHTEPTPEQLDAATKIAFGEGHVTRATLQRVLRVGYNHACAIVERLLGAKIIGPEADGRFPLIASAA